MTLYFSEGYPAASPSYGGDQTWVQASGTWVNSGSGKATTTLGGSSAYSRVNSSTAPTSDMSVTITAEAVPSGRSLGVVARANNGTTVAGSTSYMADFHFSDGLCYLLYNSSGSINTLTTFGISTPTFPATLTLSVYGTDLRAYINGVQVGTTYTDSHITSGTYSGLWVYNSSGDVSFSHFNTSSALQAPGTVSGSASLGQSTTLSATPTYIGLASATLAQASRLDAARNTDADLGQGQGLTVTGKVIGVASATLAGAPSLSVYGFVYSFAEAFPVFDGTTFGGNLTWRAIAETWFNNALGEGTCNSHGTSGAILANRDTATSDMSVRVTIDALTANRSVGVMARANSAATTLANLNAYVLDFHGDNGGQFYLLSVLDGNTTVIAGPVLAPVTLPATITLSLMGTQILVLVNGIMVGSYVDSSITTGTQAGVWSYNGNSDVQFSNFAVAGPFSQAVVYPTGIPSTAAMGNPTATNGGITSTPTGIASTTVIGQVSITTTVTLTPDGVAGISAIGTPSLAASTNVTPTGIASTLAFGTTIASTVIHAGPTGIPGQLQVGTPSIDATVTLHPTGIASSAVLGTPTIVPGPADVGPDGIPAGDALGTPTVHSSTTAGPTGIASTSVVAGPHLDSTVTVRPAGIAANSGVGTPVISMITGLRPTGIASTVAFGRPTLKRRTYYTATGIPSTAAVGNPKLHSTVSVTPTGVASSFAAGTPTLKRVFIVTPTGIASTVAFGTPHAGGSTTVRPNGILVVPSVGKPTASSGRLTVTPTGIPQQSAVGEPTLTKVVPDIQPWNRIRRLASVHTIMDE